MSLPPRAAVLPLCQLILVLAAVGGAAQVSPAAESANTPDDSRRSAAAWAGRSIADVLRSIARPDLGFLFSSQLLPDSLRVGTEPPPGDALARARAVLAPHGLTLEQVQPGLFAVARSDALRAAPAVGSRPVDAPSLEPLNEVVISASRFRVGEGIGTVNLLDAASLKAQPGLGEDPIRALQRLPGIAHDGFSARSNVRGGDSSEVLLLLDGFPLRQAFHLPSYQSLFSVIDAGLISNAEVYTGGFPARYGNRMAGVFDLRTIDATTLPQRSVGVDFFNASARVARHEEGSSFDWLASGRVGTLKPLLQVFAPNVGDPTYSDAYLRGAWGDPSTLRVTGNLIWSRDELAIRKLERGERGELESRARYLWLRFDRDWNDALESSLWFGQTRLETVRDGEAAEPQVATGTIYDRRASRLTEMRGRLAWAVTPRQLIESGFELVDENADYRYVADVTFSPQVATLFARDPELSRDLALAPERRRAAVFLSHRWRITDSLTSEIGGRAQRLFTKGIEADWISEPRLGLRWQLGPTTRVQFTWGRFNQVDEINELQLEDGVTQFAAPQRSEHLIGGLEQRLTQHLSMRIEAFRKRQSTPRARFENILDSQTILPEIAPDRTRIAPTSASLNGVELSVAFDDRQFHAWTTLGWSRAVDHVTQGWVPRAWDQTWVTSGGVQWSRARWQLSGQVDLHRGWPQTLLIRNADTGELTLGARNGAHLPMFAQLDLRAQYTIPMQRGELALTAEVINAQGHPNDCCTELVVRDGELTGKRLHWLPIVPSLGVRWNF